jgi:hypothetical protein
VASPFPAEVEQALAEAAEAAEAGEEQADLV